MRFLVDEDLPRLTDALLRRYEHEASEGLCLVTGDFDFSDIRNYPPGEYVGLVVLKLPRTATASFILNPDFETLHSWRIASSGLFATTSTYL
ncbi:MAG: hypothetical protein DDT30_01983 [Dehalococcoidia bacterium]|nr:hypothetical protein [Bacillota bacterium]